MMSHRAVIDGNIVPLCEFTNCNLRLLDECVMNGVLTMAECRDIEQRPILYDRNRSLYTQIRTKDAVKFAKLVDIMDYTDTLQSADVLAILRKGLVDYVNIQEPTVEITQQVQKTRPPEGSSILKVSDILEIAQPLSQSADLSKRRLEFFMSLGLQFAAFDDPPRNPAFDFFVSTLEKWIMASTTDRPATVAILVEKLRKMSSNSLAVAVETTGTEGLIREIGRRTSLVTGEKRATTYLIQRISIAIQRGNVAAVFETLPSEIGLDEIFYM